MRLRTCRDFGNVRQANYLKHSGKAGFTDSDAQRQRLFSHRLFGSHGWLVSNRSWLRDGWYCGPRIRSALHRVRQNRTLYTQRRSFSPCFWSFYIIHASGPSVTDSSPNAFYFTTSVTVLNLEISRSNSKSGILLDFYVAAGDIGCIDLVYRSVSIRVGV